MTPEVISQPAMETIGQAEKITPASSEMRPAHADDLGLEYGTEEPADSRAPEEATKENEA